MSGLANIVKGNIKRLTGQNSELSAPRIEICKECPVSQNKNGLYSGWCRTRNGGCGCPIKSKAAEETEECHLGKWESPHQFIAGGRTVKAMLESDEFKHGA